MKNSFLIFLISLSICSSSFAQVVPPRMSPFGNPKGSNYYVGLDKGRPLIQVNVLTGVNAPGVYHIPIGTNISELISYAGGADHYADLSEIQIRSKTKDKGHKSSNVNLDDLMSDNMPLPQLKDQDVVYIARGDGLSTSLKWMTIASLAVGIISALVIIDDRSN